MYGFMLIDMHNSSFINFTDSVHLPFHNISKLTNFYTCILSHLEPFLEAFLEAFLEPFLETFLEAFLDPRLRLPPLSLIPMQIVDSFIML